MGTTTDPEDTIRKIYPDASCEWSHDRGMFVIDDGNGGRLGEGTPSNEAWDDAWKNQQLYDTVTHRQQVVLSRLQDVQSTFVLLGQHELALAADGLFKQAAAAFTPDDTDHRKDHYEKVCSAAGYNWDFEDAPKRYLALYRDEAAEVGFFAVTLDSLPELKEYHEQGRFAIEAEDPDDHREPLWMLREVHDLDERHEVKFIFSIQFVEEA